MFRSNNFIPVSKSGNLAMLDLPDCISLSERGGCNLLRIDKCQGNGCSFRKSIKDSILAEKLCKLRLSGLDEDEQIKISAIYYSGKMPWKE